MGEWETTRLAEDQCPVCGKKLSAVSNENGDQPKPGDFSVCIGCASFLVFNDDMTVREMTDGEVGDIPDQCRIELMRFRCAIKQLTA